MSDQPHVKLDELTAAKLAAAKKLLDRQRVPTKGRKLWLNGKLYEEK